MKDIKIRCDNCLNENTYHIDVKLPESIDSEFDIDFKIIDDELKCKDCGEEIRVEANAEFQTWSG